MINWLFDLSIVLIVHTTANNIKIHRGTVGAQLVNEANTLTTHRRTMTDASSIEYQDRAGLRVNINF